MKYIDVHAALDSLPNEPTWAALVAAIALVAEWTDEAAEVRLLAAIRDGFVLATFADDCEWRIRPVHKRGAARVSQRRRLSPLHHHREEH